MKRLLIIGIGAGDPDHLTIQGAKAIAAADVFFLIDKGEEKDELVRLRRRLIEEHGRPPYRIVEGRDPERDRTAAAYAEAVENWRARRAELYRRMIEDELPDGQTGAFLVWGDPGVYDSTLSILGRLPYDYEVIPGISAISALTARHRTTLTRVGSPVHITTGRRLAEQGPTADDILVMLDSRCAFAELTDYHIYWGAYLGTPDEILIEGPVAEVADRIREVRSEVRARKGWIMDTYLLRRPR
ncbi:precorrin-6A synthase (deacetylating) [Thermobispora bispora]|uniref:precorrin-6A synthase (deacetylating) n=1 Tax=Thermobispora bispora TaxID=2006 RepID=UPI000680DEBD|nr:precorrin-6A synthase (deacetylating) [Thermobispora bispora]MBO2475837.1 precorrin-6A synthase (deacetylating) [Actinomycetales bacterium]MBX6358193.1 precorrin-6A synthase (deacetylating) [Micromonosporaceae bacterium]MDI9580296.1 precorrin-6A synthase (deacetylating) [Thermobispora sp.]QSI46796.1 precorrin-6A synthase (deacetylating) [Thermobispora bispora]